MNVSYVPKRSKILEVMHGHYEERQDKKKRIFMEKLSEYEKIKTSMPMLKLDDKTIKEIQNYLKPNTDEIIETSKIDYENYDVPGTPPSSPVVDEETLDDNDASTVSDKKITKNNTHIEMTKTMTPTGRISQFLIANGKVIESLPPFIAFKQKNIQKWGPLLSIIQDMEKLLTKYSVPLCQVDCKKLEMLAARFWMEKPTDKHLISTFVNANQVEKIIRTPGNLYKSNDRDNNALLKIQATWRMYKCRQWYLDQLNRKSAAAIFLRYFNAIKNKRYSRERLEAKKLVIICSFEIPESILSIYRNILQYHGIKMDENVIWIMPETLMYYPKYSSVIAAMETSDRTVKKICELANSVSNKLALTGKLSRKEANLVNSIDVPFFAPDVYLNPLSNRVQVMEFLQKHGLPTLPYQICTPKTEEEIFECLNEIREKHPNYPSGKDPLIIQASPHLFGGLACALFLVIYPDKNFKIEGMVDLIFKEPFDAIGFRAPSSATIPLEFIEKLCLYLYEEGIIGSVTVEFVLKETSSDPFDTEFVIVDIKPYLTMNHADFNFCLSILFAKFYDNKIESYYDPNKKKSTVYLNRVNKLDKLTNSSVNHSIMSANGLSMEQNSRHGVFLRPTNDPKKYDLLCSTGGMLDCYTKTVLALKTLHYIYSSELHPGESNLMDLYVALQFSYQIKSFTNSPPNELERSKSSATSTPKVTLSRKSSAIGESSLKRSGIGSSLKKVQLMNNYFHDIAEILFAIDKNEDSSQIMKNETQYQKVAEFWKSVNVLKSKVKELKKEKKSDKKMSLEVEEISIAPRLSVSMARRRTSMNPESEKLHGSIVKWLVEEDQNDIYDRLPKINKNTSIVASVIPETHDDSAESEKPLSFREIPQRRGSIIDESQLTSRRTSSIRDGANEFTKTTAVRRKSLSSVSSLKE
ncbi:hypothetical protein ROZALSC1DRAFT_21986 [Rozella allomycis CSF55]|uniref:Uncharacterized protein n=1 Tax=Rozella allomycis (strain CSF55) TaxID=988480 RepID=A0A4P9YK08_ROZAC|nr:hypothetical protein ROZALSC1DRAFT_21986 [Rozella allomycis CSF55]